MILGKLISKFKALLRAAAMGAVRPTEGKNEDEVEIRWATRGDIESKGEKAVTYCNAKSARARAATGRMAQM
jgi:hypothetical protein